MPKHHSKGPHGDPDRGPPMHEGAHYWDKGYTSDNEHFAPQNVYPDDHQRGNAYMQHQNEIAHRDSKKLNRGHFTKIA